jgi:hypothetical protein
MKKVSLKDQLTAWAVDGTYIDSNGNESWCFNFYDWFCRDTSLENKSDRLFSACSKFCKQMGIDQDKHYVFFKNNCPLFDHLYDDFRIVDRETGDVVWTVIPRRTHRNGDTTAAVWGKHNGFNGPIAQAQNYTQLLSSKKMEEVKLEIQK